MADKITNALNKIERGAGMVSDGNSELSDAFIKKYGFHLTEVMDGYAEREDMINMLDGVSATAKDLAEWAAEHVAKLEQSDDNK